MSDGFLSHPPASDLAQKASRFVIVGAASTLLYAALDLFMLRVAQASPVTASLAAYLMAAAFSYAGQRSFAFRSERDHAAALPRFLALTAIGCGATSTSAALAARLGLPPETALVVPCVAVPLLNYFVLDRVIFPARPNGV